ncbi:post-transcriptional regulator [Traorella massiliensis]|uniref:post-transcriptional regulator n=1 Tax=Traorella massiliensis TaxID=1903263 RepID=UPI0008F9425E|nr:post-transcriptional regulator [Traorella massiliensis]
MDSKLQHQIELAIAIKTSQLQRCDLKSITEQHVRDTLYGSVWKNRPPKTFSKAVDDIFKITVNEIVAYLSSQAIILGGQMDESELDALIGEYSW